EHCVDLIHKGEGMEQVGLACGGGAPPDVDCAKRAGRAEHDGAASACLELCIVAHEDALPVADIIVTACRAPGPLCCPHLFRSFASRLAVSLFPAATLYGPLGSLSRPGMLVIAPAHQQTISVDHAACW